VRRIQRRYGTAVERWAGVGPYYAMFPTWFSDDIVERYSSPGESVLDPFAGRGTAIVSAGSLGRVGLGIEISPVGWVYGRTKLGPARLDQVVERIEELGSAGWRFRKSAKELPTFFKLCFAMETRSFLLAAREYLDWRRSGVDRTVMALLMVHLHGKSEDALSNQLRQTKAMSPEYAIRWWRERGMRPPERDPVDFLLDKLTWRYAKGTPSLTGSAMYLGDSVAVLPKLSARVEARQLSRPKLMLTSPPYRLLANYHYDQWLRLWLLGGPPHALRQGGRHRGKFEGLEKYERLLAKVFSLSAALLSQDSVIYVRTSRRADTSRATAKALRDAFPQHVLRRRLRPFAGPTQTHLFGDRSQKVGEVDLILTPATIRKGH
jgi:hypothetical protein